MIIKVRNAYHVHFLGEVQYAFIMVMLHITQFGHCSVARLLFRSYRGNTPIFRVAQK
jgi:hypothetical protein